MPRALEVAGDACVEAVTAAGIAPQRSLMRIDGAGSSAVALDPIAKRGIQHLVRLKSYGVFRLRAVQQLLAAGTWQWVTDSGSGPRRQALDIGSWQLGADAFQTATDAPVVPTRLVVSRYATDHKHGAGVLIEGWLYELLARAWTPARGRPPRPSSCTTAAPPSRTALPRRPANCTCTTCFPTRREGNGSRCWWACGCGTCGPCWARAWSVRWARGQRRRRA